MVSNELIAVITEGSAETAILELLLENNLLIFDQTDLLDGEIIRSRSARAFQTQRLNKATSKPIHIYRILDSRKEHFKLGKAYSHRVSKIESLYTRPEIEILYIINENQYSSFQNSGLKAHEYVNQEMMAIMPKGRIKTHDYVRAYWERQMDHLVSSIRACLCTEIP